MKKFLTILLSCVSLMSFGQSETHDFITYDSLYQYHFDAFHEFDFWIRFSRPRNLFTAGSPDTASRPAIITMPGVGEMGSDTTKLYSYGPHYFLKQGTWDGSVVLGNGTHYPILITIICNVNPPQPPLAGCIEIINYLIAHYHIKPHGVHLGGLSEGAFTWTAMLGITDTTGTNGTLPDVGMKMVTSVTALSGAATPNSGASAWAFAGRWAKVYGGHAFATVGFADAQVTNPPLFTQNMNDSTAGSAYFTYNTIGSGSHCCWNTDYDPTLHLWNSGVAGATPAGTYVTTNSQPNTQGSYISGSSIFQWMLRQGDTTLVGQGQAVLQAKKVATAEYANAILATNDTVYMIQSGGTGNYQALPLPNSELVQDISPGFNTFRAVSTVGHYYISNAYNVAQAWHQETTDTTNASLNNCLAVWSWADAAVIQRSDSSLWLADNDTMGIIHALGTRYIIGKPIKLSQTGVKYVHVSMGSKGIYGTTSDGKVYLWAYGSNSLTPVQKWDGTGGHMMMTATGSSDMVVGIVRNATGDTTSGNVYALGASWGDIGGTSVTYSVFTNVMTLLGLNGGTAKVVSMNSNSFNVIDNAGKLWAVAKCNSQGEAGNGVEFVNRYTYSTYDSIGWTFNNTENPLAAPMVLIGTKMANVFTNSWFTFYRFAIDSSGNLYSWGRGKTAVLGNGWLLNVLTTANENHSNAVDVTIPTKVNPFTAVTQSLNFTPPSASAGSNKSIGTTSTTVTASGIPITLTLATNSLDTILYKIVSYSWIRTSGTGTIVSPSSQSTVINGLSNGVSHFQVTETDNNGGMDTAGITITVSTTNPSVSAGSNQTVTTSTAMIFGTCSGNGGATMTSANWIILSIPSGAPTPTQFASGIATAPTLQLSGLVAGVYTIQLTGTDSNNNTNTSTVTVTVTSSGTPNTVTLPVPIKIKS